MTLRHVDIKIVEADLHRAVAKLLEMAVLPPAVWTTFPAGWGRLPPSVAGRLRGCGLKSGFPDILIFHNARCIGIELKAPKSGVVSKTQHEMHNLLINAGMTIHVCRGTEEVFEALKQEELPLRKLGFAA